VSGRRGSVASDAQLAATAAATTWIAMCSWAGFTMVPGRFLGPLFLLGAVVAGAGVLARWWRLPGPAVVGVQVLVSGAVASAMLSGSPLPVGAAWTRLSRAVDDALTSADRYAAPVPSDVPGVHPLLIPGGLVCLLLVDVLACTARRVPLAGLPLLMIYSVPVSLVGGGVAWWVFTLTALGFLRLLFLQEGEQIARWGRPLGRTPAEAEASSGRGSAGALRRSAGAIGGAATTLALFVPLLIPTLDLHLLDGGRGGGSGSDITITNPMTDLRRDLLRGDDFPVLTVSTDDPEPAYLRISVLTRFSDNEWSAGDRDVPTDHLADGQMPELVGVSPSLPRREYHYAVDVTDSFDSRWLPTQAPISGIEADGDWRYDDSTMDFIAGDDDLTTSGISYSMTGVKLDLQASDLAQATTFTGAVSRDYLATPTSLPSMVPSLAAEVTREAPTRFEKAVALQNWFRRDGHFTYSLDVAPGNGTDDLVRFLTPGNGGRVGYCEQFASAYAVMARTLDIPARVAVGFLDPQQVGPGTWEYSSYDLHAWPELYFPGSGWVRFEPTPSGRGTDVPGYTRQDVPVVNPTQQPQTALPSDAQPSRAPSDTQSADESAQGVADAGSGFPWLPVAGGTLGAALLAVLALLPRWLRRSRRERRLAGGPEEAWAELRATALDLGLPWPEGRSPRETRGRLIAFFGAEEDAHTAERPRHGADVAPEAVAALDRVVRALELSRYARTWEPGTPQRADVEACLAALHGGAPRAARRRAEWWPRSVVSARSQRRRVMTAPSRVEAKYGGVVDHVG
jgi:transglutaminase-like putative cysteine protease